MSSSASGQRDGWDRQAQDAVVARHTVSIERLDERAAALDAAMTALSDRAGALARPDGSFRFEPWYDTNAFARVFRGQGLVERYKDLLGRFVGHGPVLDIGCGDGQFVAELEKLGLRARGVDVDPATIAVALEQGLNVELADGMEALAACAPGSLGGILCIQVIEHLPRQAVIDLPRLAARALVPGGILVIETVNPASLYAMTHWYYLDPTHLQPIPADLITFLTGQAGFRTSEVEWRSPVAGSELLPPADEPEGVGPRTAERLNQVLFAAQDYAVIATR